MKLSLAYRDHPVRTSIGPSVHMGEAGKAWLDSQIFEPPFPPRIPGKGYRVWILSHRKRSLEFASPEEIEHAIHILSRKVLPRPWQLTTGSIWRGKANQHWLSRLHKSWTSWAIRQEMVKCLKLYRDG